MFVPLNPILINKDYSSREIDLITFKSILAKLELFTNTINSNTVELKNSIEGLADNQGTKITISTNEPLDQKLGDYWIKII